MLATIILCLSHRMKQVSSLRSVVLSCNTKIIYVSPEMSGVNATKLLDSIIYFFLFLSLYVLVSFVSYLIRSLLLKLRYLISYIILFQTYLSRVMRKPTFSICKNKDADQLRGYRGADQRLCFRFLDSTIPLLPKYKISSL